MFKELAEVLQSDKYLSPDALEKMKKDLLALGTVFEKSGTNTNTNITTNNKILLQEIKSKVIEDFVRTPQINDENNVEDFDTKVARYMQLIDAQTKDKKYNDNKITKELNDLLKNKKRKANDDDDLEVVNDGLKEGDFKCPITAAFFERPMKHKNCKHRIDENALQSLCAKGRNEMSGKMKCPHPGCSSIWKYSDCEVDHDLLFQLESYQRKQERSQKDIDATYVDEDEEYTHI